MMCSIHIDKSVIRMSIAARLPRLYVHFSKKLNNLLDPLDNWRMMHGSQNDALEWARENQNDAHYYSRVTLHGL
jgi:hypothetical protein